MLYSLLSDRLWSVTAGDIQSNNTQQPRVLIDKNAATACVNQLTHASPNTREHPQTLPSDLPVKLRQQGRQVFIQNLWCLSFFPLYVFCILFSIIKQIWHPCGKCNRNNIPSRELSPSANNPLSRELFLLYYPQGCHIWIIATFKYCTYERWQIRFTCQ